MTDDALRAPAAAGDRGTPWRTRDGLLLAVLGLWVRAAVVAWAAARFPPVEDGHFYDVVARRIARGLGYTWAWPDGAVTYAAHYPVGYPALVGGMYAVFGPRPVVAMALNAVLGSAAVWATHNLASRVATRLGALVAGLAIALHPGLVFYAPALMTEGVTAALVVVAAALAAAPNGARVRRFLTLVAVLGVATLVRPQSLLLAPFFGAIAALAQGAASSRLRAAVVGAVLVTAGTVVVCLPWTVRNCDKMHACLLVSANSGWNAFIGAAGGATGSFTPIEKLGVPAECRTVWDEAEKDACFGAAARREIAKNPLRFLALVPTKLAYTFDYAGAAGWYLHTSNSVAFSDGAKWTLGVLETLWQRLLVGCALLATARAPGPRRHERRAVSVASTVPLLFRAAWLSHIGLIASLVLLGRRALGGPYAAALATLAVTAATHAAFFGAGRYSLVCFPAIAALAGCAWTRRDGTRTE